MSSRLFVFFMKPNLVLNFVISTHFCLWHFVIAPPLWSFACVQIPSHLLLFLERTEISGPDKDLKLFLAKYGRFRIIRKIRRVYGSPKWINLPLMRRIGLRVFPYQDSQGLRFTLMNHPPMGGVRLRVILFPKHYRLSGFTALHFRVKIA